jgi:hypothetical protein
MSKVETPGHTPAPAGLADCGTGGGRLIGKAPFVHWNTATFLAALRNDRVEAPWLVNGPINGERFLVYVSVPRHLESFQSGVTRWGYTNTH